MIEAVKIYVDAGEKMSQLSNGILSHDDNNLNIWLADVRVAFS